MKHMKSKVLQLLSAVSVVSLLSGCATQTLPEVVTAEYLLPPKAIVDIKAVDALSIAATTKLTGNGIDEQDRSYANGALQQRMAARLCQEGFFKVTDIVWGNAEGVATMGNTLDKKGSQHGYAHYSTDSTFKRAVLTLELNAEITAKEVGEKVKFELEDVPYVIDREKRVPTSHKNEEQIVSKEVETVVKTHHVDGRGSLTAKLVDKSGKLVYERTFEDLHYHFENGLHEHEAVPPNAAVVVNMIVPAVELLVQDLSPYKVKRSFRVNEKGAEKPVLLLRAQAYTEAIRELDKIEEKTSADFENLGLAYEVLGDLFAARDAFSQAVELEDGSLIATSGLERINELLEAKKKLRKMNVGKAANQYKKAAIK